MPHKTVEAEIKMPVHSQRAVAAERTAERRAYQMDCRGRGQRSAVQSRRHGNVLAPGSIRVFRDVEASVNRKGMSVPEKSARFIRELRWHRGEVILRPYVQIMSVQGAVFLCNF